MVVLCIPFFCSTRAASILPSRPHISIAVARSGGQGRRFFSAAEGLSLTDASTAAGCRRSGRLAVRMIRGEPAIGRDQSREPRLYSVEPEWGPDHESSFGIDLAHDRTKTLGRRRSAQHQTLVSRNQRFFLTPCERPSYFVLWQKCVSEKDGRTELIRLVVFVFISELGQNRKSSL